MIKKILIILMVAGMFSAHAQVEVFDGFILDTLTTLQLDALPAKVKIKGAHFYNKDISSLVGWDGTAWVAIGGAIADGSITEAKLNTPVNASLDLADSSVQPGDYPNLDTDSTDDVTLGGEQTITGFKTHESDILMENATSIQFQDLQSNDLQLYDFAAFNDGFRILPQTRPTTGDLYTSHDQLRFDFTSKEWRIGANRILTTLDGVGGTGDLWSDPVDSDIVPDGNATRDLGTAPNRFAIAYINTIIMGGNALSGTGNITPLVTGSSIIGNSTYGYNSIYLEPTDTEPTVSKGAVYFDDSESTLKQYNGTVWEALNSGVGGDLWSDPVDSDIVPTASNLYHLGSETNSFVNFFAEFHYVKDDSATNKNWRLAPTSGNLAFQQETGADTNTYTTEYTLGDGGTPTIPTDLIPKSYADANYSDLFLLSISGPNQFQTSLKVEADGVSNNGSVTITKNDGVTVIGGMSGFGDTDRVEIVNTVSSESFSIDGSGNYNLSAFSGGGNLALAVNNNGDLYTTTIGAGTIQSDTTGLGSTAYLPITNLIAWDYSVSTTPPSLSPNGYGIQINAPANLAVDATMDGSEHQQKLIYDDRTTDAANITFSALELGQEIVIYMNRAALPTFSGATMKVIVTGSEAFQADTETVLYGFVNPDGEIDYTIKELTP